MSIWLLTAIILAGAAFYYAWRGMKVPLPNIPAMPKISEIVRPRTAYQNIGAKEIGNFFDTQPQPCILDVRSDQETRASGLRSKGNTVIAYIPFDTSSEDEFRKNVCESSQLIWMYEERRNILVVCSHGVRSARASEILFDLGFKPINMMGGLKDVPPEYRWWSRAYTGPPP